MTDNEGGEQDSPRTCGAVIVNRDGGEERCGAEVEKIVQRGDGSIQWRCEGHAQWAKADPNSEVSDL